VSKHRGEQHCGRLLEDQHPDTFSLPFPVLACAVASSAGPASNCFPHCQLHLAKLNGIAAGSRGMPANMFLSVQPIQCSPHSRPALPNKRWTEGGTGQGNTETNIQQSTGRFFLLAFAAPRDNVIPFPPSTPGNSVDGMVCLLVPVEPPSSSVLAAPPPYRDNRQGPLCRIHEHQSK
jgi:hypothetical protein